MNLGVLLVLTLVLDVAGVVTVFVASARAGLRSQRGLPRHGGPNKVNWTEWCSQPGRTEAKAA